MIDLFRASAWDIQGDIEQNMAPSYLLLVELHDADDVLGDLDVGLLVGAADVVDLARHAAVQHAVEGARHVLHLARTRRNTRHLRILCRAWRGQLWWKRE